MASVKPIRIQNFQGGINTGDPTIIEDNQLADVINFFYDHDKILTTRRGSKDLGDACSDTVVLLANCDDHTAWTAGGDAANKANGTAIRGTQSVQFDIDVSADAGNQTTLTESSLGTIDISAALGSIKFYLAVPASFNTELTDVRLRLGSDSSNYHEWTLSTLTENATNFIKLDFGDETDTGTPDDTSIDYAQLIFNYTASYTDKTGIRLDAIYAYSDTATKAIHTIRFHEETDGTRHLLAGCGTNIFEYRETQQLWEVINTGLTDGLRFDSVMFKDVIYITNGTDNYRDYDGVTITEYAGVGKGKFLVVVNDVAFMGGVATDPSTIFYTASNPTNLQSYANNETVDEDNGQILTGLSNIGALIIAMKERSTYIFNVATPSIEQIDYDGGCKSHRSIARVENNMFFLSENGVFSLEQRKGTSGTVRGDPLSNDIRTRMDDVDNKTISAGIYWPATNNYYLAVDDSGTSTNRTIYVWSTLVNSWTRYKGINANQFAIWIDTNGDEHLVVANAYGGQVIDMETGFDDSGNVINYELRTKTYDFGMPESLITYERADIGGFHSEQSTMDVDIELVTTKKVTRSKTISFNAATDESGGTALASLGIKTLASTPLGGGSSSGTAGDLTLYPFFRHAALYSTGRNSTVKFSKAQKNAAFKLTKINLWPIKQPKSFTPTALYL